MNKPLVYIDQNVIGRQALKEIDLRSSEFQWVYSKQHFAEFGESDNFQQYLNALEEIDARLIEIEYDHKFQVQNSCIVHSSGTPTEHFKKYKNAIAEVSFDTKVLCTPIAWLNGNRDIEALKNHPNQLIFELQKMLQKCSIKIEDIPGGSDFENMLIKNQKIMASIQEPIEKIRSHFGPKNGFSDYSKKDNPLQEIWHTIKESYPNLTSDQFFGFRPYSDMGEIPKFLAVIGCCGVLDIIGFHAEKKIRKISKIPNILSDATHIAFGIFCSGIMSGDDRLCERARAIYKYAGIHTFIARVSSSP